MARLIIIGNGAWGKALYNIAIQKNFMACCILGRQDSYEIPSDDCVVLAIPSTAYSDICPKIHGLNRVIIATKGLVAGQLIHDFCQNIWGHEIQYAYLSGPNFAHEIMAQKPAACVIASQHSELITLTKQVFNLAHFRIYECDDMIGVALCGVMKNILSIGAGIIKARDLGENAHAAFLTRGIYEWSHLLQIMGGKIDTIYGLSGIGDLFLSAHSMQSRNTHFGILLGNNMPIPQAKQEINQPIEGYNACEFVFNLIKKYDIKMPITTAIYRVLYENTTIDSAINQLLNHDKIHHKS